MYLAVDPDKHLIKMPAPVRIGSMMNAACPELGCKQRTKAVPPVPHRLITNVDATFEQNVFDLAQRKRIYNITARRMTSGELLK